MNIEHKPYNPAPIRLTRVHIGLNKVNKMNTGVQNVHPVHIGLNTGNPHSTKGKGSLFICSFLSVTR